MYVCMYVCMQSISVRNQSINHINHIIHQSIHISTISLKLLGVDVEHQALALIVALRILVAMLASEALQLAHFAIEARETITLAVD